MFFKGSLKKKRHVCREQSYVTHKPGLFFVWPLCKKFASPGSVSLVLSALSTQREQHEKSSPTWVRLVREMHVSENAGNSSWEEGT